MIKFLKIYGKYIFTLLLLTVIAITVQCKIKKAYKKGVGDGIEKVTLNYMSQLGDMKETMDSLYKSNFLLGLENQSLLITASNKPVKQEGGVVYIKDTITIYANNNDLPVVNFDSIGNAMVKAFNDGETEGFEKAFNTFKTKQEAWTLNDSLSQTNINGHTKGFKVFLDEVSLLNTTSIIERDTSIGNKNIRSIIFRNSAPALKSQDKMYVYTYKSEKQLKKEKREKMWNGLGGGVALSAVVATIVTILTRK